jgi:hypothetical protein
MRCFFQRLGDCSGRSQRAHWVPKQRLRKAGLREDAIWDKRAWVLMCERCHHRFDKGFIRLRLEDYPADFLAYAAEHDFFWAGDREGWRLQAVRVPTL